MYAVMLQECNNYTRMRQAKPRIAVTRAPQYSHSRTRTSEMEQRQKALARAMNVKEDRIVLESVRIRVAKRRRDEESIEAR